MLINTVAGFAPTVSAQSSGDLPWQAPVPLPLLSRSAAIHPSSMIRLALASGAGLMPGLKYVASGTRPENVVGRFDAGSAIFGTPASVLSPTILKTGSETVLVPV